MNMNTITIPCSGSRVWDVWKSYSVHVPSFRFAPVSQSAYILGLRV